MEDHNTSSSTTGCNKRIICSGFVILGIIIVIAVAIPVSLLTGTSSKVSYRNQMTLQAKFNGEEDLKMIDKLDQTNRGIRSFKVKHLGVSQIQLDRENLNFVEDYLRQANISYIILTADTQDLIDQIEMDIEKRKQQFKSSEFDVGNFHPYEEITAYLKKLSRNNEMVNVINLGQTYEGRDILMAIVSIKSSQLKPIVFIDCTIHSNEWITTSTCLWIINELSTKYKKDPEITRLIELYDWYIKPVTNPDGYVYTWTTDRLWRKNRVPLKGTTCYGVDLNRNFNTAFEETDKYSNKVAYCARTYKGPYPFSEQETKAIRDVLIQVKSRVKLALFVHSSGQLWMSPYALNETLPPHYNQMELLMKKSTAAIEAVYGTKYTYGSVPSILYPASSSTIDYAYDKMGIVHTYGIELPDQGTFASLAPVNRILPIAEETWIGIKTAALTVSE